MKTASLCLRSAWLNVALGGVLGVLSGCRVFDERADVRVDRTGKEYLDAQVACAKEELRARPLRSLMCAIALKRNAPAHQKVAQLYAQALARVKEAFRYSVEKQKWSEALVFFRSLSALRIPLKDWTERSLHRAQIEQWKKEGAHVLVAAQEKRAGTSAARSPAAMIKGTVTILVDRGIRVEHGRGFADRVIGSGFFIDKRGYIVTNYHVIRSEVDPAYEGYSRAYIKLPSDNTVKVPVRVVGWDALADLALLKTEITPEVVFGLGSSKNLDVGSKIYAIGSPAGLERTLTSGIVSAKKRKLLSVGGGVLQIDASINRGNSGGPVIDEEGCVQAVAFAGVEQHAGLNFAIPVELLKQVLPSLYRGGLVTHPWLGAFGETHRVWKNAGVGGVLSSYVIPGSPLSYAGIPEGAIITTVNDASISCVADLQAELEKYVPETIVRLAGYRLRDKSKLHDLAAYEQDEWYCQLGVRPEHPARILYKYDLSYRAFLPLFGMRLARTGTRNTYRVESLVPGNFADEHGFSTYDVIEIQNIYMIEASEAIVADVYAKRRKAGYIDTFMRLVAALDNPSFF